MRLGRFVKKTTSLLTSLSSSKYLLLLSSFDLNLACWPVSTNCKSLVDFPGVEASVWPGSAKTDFQGNRPDANNTITFTQIFLCIDQLPQLSPTFFDFQKTV